MSTAVWRSPGVPAPQEVVLMDLWSILVLILVVCLIVFLVRRI
jgi:hypothetical protein